MSYYIIISFLFHINASASALNPSIYYIKMISLDVDKAECTSKRTIYSTAGKAMYTVCKESYNSCVIEGTCAIVKDSDSDEISIINYVNTIAGIPQFQTLDDDHHCEYGLGVKNICLDPFYSVAADLNYHKPGDVIYIDKLKGLKLPNGEVHNGFMIVRDRGGAIKGANRFDFYTGFLNYRDKQNPFTPLGFANSNNAIPYRKATADEASSVRQSRRYPLIP